MKQENKALKLVVQGIALVLVLLFFSVPLVSCSMDSSITANGWEIASGTGDMMSDDSAHPFAFFLLLIPLAIVGLGFLKRSAATLMWLAIAGIANKFLFIFWVIMQDSFQENLIEFTSFTWIVLLLYAGLLTCAIIAAASTKKVAHTHQAPGMFPGQPGFGSPQPGQYPQMPQPGQYHNPPGHYPGGPSPLSPPQQQQGPKFCTNCGTQAAGPGFCCNCGNRI